MITDRRNSRSVVIEHGMCLAHGSIKSVRTLLSEHFFRRTCTNLPQSSTVGPPQPTTWHCTSVIYEHKVDRSNQRSYRMDSIILRSPRWLFEKEAITELDTTLASGRSS